MVASRSDSKDAATPSLRFREVCLSGLFFAVVVALLFHDITLQGRTLASAPHVPFTLPTGPVGFQWTRSSPFFDARGPAVTHETSLPYRRRALAAGRIPFWHPHEACGQPYLAGYLPGLLHPLHALMLAGPTPLGIDLVCLGRLIMAGWFLFLFLRVHRLSRLASGTGALLYLGCGYLVTGANLSNATVESTTPALLLVCELLFTRGRGRDVLLGAIVVYLVLAGGNPEAAFLALVLGASYGIGSILFRIRYHRLRRFGLLVAAHLGGALLAAPQILPFLEFYALSEHFHHAADQPHSASLSVLALFVVPGFFDRIAMDDLPVFYGVGLVGCVLATLGLASPRRFLKAFAGIAFVVVAGVFFAVPGFHLVGRLPFLDQFALDKYPAPLLCLLAAVLAGLGVEVIGNRQVRRPGRALALAVVAVSLVPLGFILAWPAGPGGAPVPVDRGPGQAAATPCLGTAPWLLAALLALAVGLAFRPRRALRVAWGLSLLVLVEIYLAVPRLYPPRQDIYKPPPFLADLDTSRSGYRIFSAEPILEPNSATVFGLNDIRYHEVLKVARYVTFVRRAFDIPFARYCFKSLGRRIPVPVHALSLTGVRYVLAGQAVVPLLDHPVPPWGRVVVEVDLRGGGSTLAGTLVVSPGEGGTVVLRIQETTPFQVGPPGTFRPGEGVKVQVHEFTAENDLVPSLGVHFERGQFLELVDLTWNDRPVTVAMLRAGGDSLRLTGRPEVGESFQSLPTGGIKVRSPFLLPLPIESISGPVALRIRARAQGCGPVSTALLHHRSQTCFRVPFDNPSLCVQRNPFHVDLRSLVGRKLDLSIEVSGLAWLEDLRLQPEGLRHQRTLGGVRIYENTRALPRAFGVYEAEVIEDEDAQLERLLDLEFPYRDRVILDEQPARALAPSGLPARRPEVRWIADDPGGTHIELEATFSAPGLLVLLDTDYPGWTARVDGEPVKIQRANYTFRAVAVPAGTHRVRFDYRPTHWSLSLMLAGAGLVLLILVGWKGGARRIRPPAVTGRPRPGAGGPGPCFR